jgi:hypothetical protein
MNEGCRRDRKSRDARIAGISRSPLLQLPIRLNFLGQEKNQELLLPSAPDCAGSGAIAKDQRRRLDEERRAGFNQSADLSTYPRKISVRTTRATAVGQERLIAYPAFLAVQFPGHRVAQSDSSFAIKHRHERGCKALKIFSMLSNKAIDKGSSLIFSANQIETAGNPFRIGTEHFATLLKQR